MIPRSDRPRMSSRRRKLWLWTGAMLGGTILLALIVWRIERSRDAGRSNVGANVSTVFAQSAVALETSVRFTDVTVQSGIRMTSVEPPRRHALPEDNGTGLAWGDYNGDGWPDLYVVRHTGGNRLFRNNGNGSFTDVTAQAGVGNPTDFGIAATWVDYDDDGLLDLYVTNRGTNRLYHNNGDGTFTDVAARAGVADTGWSTGVAWGDFDRDGRIDLYVCHYVRYDSDGRELALSEANMRGTYQAPFTLNPSSYDPEPNRLYRNRGDGTFEDVTARSGVADLDGRSLGATFCDFDGDGWLDLYVANDVSRNRLYRNGRGDRTDVTAKDFVDISAQTGAADPRSSMGVSVGDLGSIGDNPSGLPGLFVTHWVAEGNALYQASLTSKGNFVYRDMARRFNLDEISLDRVGWGCSFADIDLDGRIDIVVANGSTLEKANNPALLKTEPMFILMNDGSGFHDVAPLAGAATVHWYNARGLAVADYDHDGKPDIAIMTTEGLPVLLHNETVTSNRSLTIKLKGRAAWCFGAKIEIWVGGRMQTQWYGADVSYLSMHSTDMIFGLGKAATVDRICVHWSDGKISNLQNIPAGFAQIDHTTAIQP